MNLRPQQPIARRQSNRPQSGFTLVEVLTVIVIIGILAAITVPAVQVAMRAARRGSIRLEIDNMTQALEGYRLEFGEYPPDFVDWRTVERHYLKAFPDIDQNELLLLQRLTDVNPANDIDFSIAIAAHNPVAMNRAEALAWALGGFSNDKKRPFTGQGGPLVKIGEVSPATTPPTPIYQINNDRERGLFEIDNEQLTVFGTGTEADEVDPGATLGINNRYLSNDDAGTAVDPYDLFPTIINPSAQGTPYVYFDARTYDYQVPSTPATIYSGEFNGYAGNGGVVRPFLTERAVPKTTTSAYADSAAALKAWKFAQPESFQIISAGLDGSFGSLERRDVDGDGIDDPLYWQFPAGTLVAAMSDGSTASNPNDLVVPNVSKYQESAISGSSDNPVLDNITNFSNSDLESDLP